MRYTIALLRSILFWLLFVLMSSVASIGAVVMLPISHRATIWFVRVWARFHRLICRFVLGQRIVIEGAMSDTPVLYVFKHESAFETIEQPILFRHPAVFAKEELFAIPVWGQAARFYGLIPVDRDGGGKAMRAMLGAAKAALAKGRPLVLFAEGTRVPHGQAPQLRPGFAGMYRLLGVPVIPVAVDSGVAYPPRRWVKWPGTITYRIGETIPPGLPREEAEERVRAAINALNPPEALLESNVAL
ncbi:lysophospholipid acyltransferase family protein [Sphingopyxis alaskensis]|jgi:1-acyl-sn-glycerol-3-phosphate acyltransferase|uniref:Phospholipid/glycerol acyltransferase n=1 Tax=Sphingopyxis alaskensis (strain DSM 13593 / LMG 18877 / RB2256) TaxID=317655 RepID=Q1GP28_SPHAL|nr:lysophospholipid acyltransferase family protein [Sphingopyxis alaskensis]ABF54594.1 phospholipid/glycerol acyltransferase [Sphingopyxis alaskensis RB2256]MCM3418566.1 1-acyl-sn-glycerol-3-phosphate acyltransferase [Sphingopyxis alaskensis]